MTITRRHLLGAVAGVGLTAAARPGFALDGFDPFAQGVAESVAGDEALAAYYRRRDFAPVWLTDDTAAADRRMALMTALTEAPTHGLSPLVHDAASLAREAEEARGPLALGRLDVMLSRAWLRLAHDLSGGALDPSRLIGSIKRERTPLDVAQTLDRAVRGGIDLHALAPQTPEYARLLRERARLVETVTAGGWGEAPGGQRMEPGESGGAVVALRDRLIGSGHLAPTSSATYDDALAAAVARAQADHGLTPDGVAGEATLAALNVPAAERLKAVNVALERERWNAVPRGARHIWVNLTDFTAQVIDEDETTFLTRAVVGAVDPDRETPEFSELMEYMVINPSWYVPRSIVVNEYLPALQRNRNAAGHLRITDSRGRLVDRGSINFAAYTASTFPYAMHQTPSDDNALGIVKFMFPNPWNIYLHDTPAKALFEREVRAFSHGCIRLADPVGFARHLLARQSTDPDGEFQSRLVTGAESRVDLMEPVPVHLDYRTAFTKPRGGLAFRADIYGRDAVLWQALSAQGVVA